MRAFWRCASTTVLQGEGYGREFSGYASERRPNGPKPGAERHRDRLDPVSRPSKTSVPGGTMLLVPVPGAARSDMAGVGSADATIAARLAFSADLATGIVRLLSRA